MPSQKPLRKILAVSEYSENTSSNYVPYSQRAIREPTEFHPRVERFYRSVSRRNQWETLRTKLLEKA